MEAAARYTRLAGGRCGRVLRTKFQSWEREETKAKAYPGLALLLLAERYPVLGHAVPLGGRNGERVDGLPRLLQNLRGDRRVRVRRTLRVPPPSPNGPDRPLSDGAKVQERHGDQPDRAAPVELPPRVPSAGPDDPAVEQLQEEDAHVSPTKRRRDPPLPCQRAERK